VADHKTIFAILKFDSKRSQLLPTVEKYYSEFSKKRANFNLKTQDIIAAGQQDISDHSLLKIVIAQAEPSTRKHQWSPKNNTTRILEGG